MKRGSDDRQAGVPRRSASRVTTRSVVVPEARRSASRVTTRSVVVLLLLISFMPADRSIGEVGSASGALTSAVISSATTSFSPHLNRDEFISPLRQAPAPHGRAARHGVLPVVRLQVDHSARAELRRELRRRGVEEVTLRDFILAPEQPGAAPQSVDLHVHDIPVFSEFTQFVDGSRAGDPLVGGLGLTLPKPELTVLGGRVAGEPDSHVFLSFSDHGTHGFVRIGTRLQIVSSGPEGEGRDLIIFDSDALPAGTIPWRDFVCDVHNVPQPAPPAAKIGGGVAGGSSNECRRAIVAIETDHEYTADVFGGNTGAAAAYVGTLIAASSEIFNSHIGVGFEVGFVRLWSEPNDPWTAGTTGTQLPEFRDYWNDNMTAVPRHLAHFLSGRNLGGGIAYMNGLCHATHGYALSAGLNGFFPYPLQNNHPQNWDIFVVAHEFGHNFGVAHTHNYCPPLDQCASDGAMGACQDETVCQVGTIMSYCHTCGGQSNIILEFHPQIAADMLAFVDGIPPAACSLACDPWTSTPDGDFCLPNAPIPCASPEDRPAGWHDWKRLGRNNGMGAFPAEEFDNYGLAVAVDGDVAIVGAPRHDVDSGQNMFAEVGAVYVFRHIESSQEWVQVAKLSPPSACEANFLRFGSSVAIASSPDQDVAVIGAPTAVSDGQSNKGAVWVFRRVGPTWPSTENWQMEPMIVDHDEKDPPPPVSDCDATPRLTATDGFGGDLFGESVAVMPFRIGVDFCGGGDVIVVGAASATPIAECGSAFMTGAGYVFRYDPIEGGWRQEGKLVPTCSVFAQFGASVAAGFSTVFNQEVIAGGAWLASAPMPPSDENGDGENGDENGDENGNGEPPTIDWAGAAYTFRASTFVDDEGVVSAFWFADAALGANHPRQGDLFGLSIDFDSSHDHGDLLIVGAPMRDLGDEETAHHHGDLQTNEGAAFIFRRAFGGLWTEEAELISFDPRMNSSFGGAVGIAGSMAVVGAYAQPGPHPDNPGEEMSHMGAAYVYRAAGNEWNEEAELFPFGPFHSQGPDEFGVAVGLSRNSIVIGARREQDNNILGSGAAYTYGRCPPPCPGSGSCFGPNPTPGCSTFDGACCEAICAAMPLCCQGFWGMACVAEAMSACGGCGSVASGSCSVPNGSPGCATGDCCAAVCSIDEFCCVEEWDASCVALASNFTACTAFECPGTGDCNSAHGGTGCEDDACCEAVCTVDAFCCQVMWDGNCAAHAADLCAPPCPADINGDGVVNVFDMLDLLAAWGPCPDCPPSTCPADINGDCVINVFDMLDLLAGWGPCP